MMRARIRGLARTRARGVRYRAKCAGRRRRRDWRPNGASTAAVRPSTEAKPYPSGRAPNVPGRRLAKAKYCAAQRNIR
jgi:hypothetical protein